MVRYKREIPGDKMNIVAPGTLAVIGNLIMWTRRMVEIPDGYHN